MKLMINFEIKDHEIEIQGPVRVSDLLSFLKENLNIEKEKVLKLVLQDKYLLDDDILNENKTNEIFYLITFDMFTGEKVEDKKPDMLELIAKVTEAKGNIEVNNPSSQNPTNQQVSANPELIKQLKEMGFSENRCIKVLVYTKNNINNATEMLISGQDHGLPDM